VQRLQNLLAGNFIHPRQVRPDLPQDLEIILARSLAIDPNQRFQTAEQMRLALEQFLIARNTIVTPTDVGNLVRELCGATVEEHRARIRQASSVVPDDSTYSGTGNTQISSTRTPGPITVQGPIRRGMRRSTAMAITFVAGGITLAGLLGIAGVATFPVRRANATPGPTPSAVVPTTPVTSETIRITPKPAEAVVEVNGVLIGAGEQKIVRPKAGAMVTVVLKAQGYDPTTINIDHDAKGEWEIELAKSAPPPAASSAPAAAVEPPAAPAQPTAAAAPPAQTATAAPPKSKGGPAKTTPPPANTPTKASPGPKPLPKPGGKNAGIPVNPY
jgi:serine/threonine-protein kinase